MFRILRRAVFELTLRTVPAKWRAAVRQDLEEEAAARPARLSLVACCREALVIGARLRRATGGARPSRFAWFEGATGDVRYAARMFARQKGIAVLTIAGLALAIGVSTAVFSVANALAFRGDGIANASSVFRARLESNSREAPWTARDYQRLKTESSLFDAAALGWGYAGSVPFSQAANADVERRKPMSRALVSGNYFQVLGGRAVVGRTLLPADDAPGATAVVVLGHTFWKSAFQSDPDVLGRTVWIDNYPFPIVGVAEAGFSGPVEATAGPPDAWMTLTAGDEAAQTRERAHVDSVASRIAAIRAKDRLTADDLERLDILKADLAFQTPPPGSIPVIVIGRTGVDVSRERAETEVAAIARGLGVTRETNAADPANRQIVRLVPVDERTATGILGLPIPAILAVIAAIILVACSNLANVMLANAAGRRQEIGTRLALGATRWRLARQLLIESLLMSVLAGALGWMCAVWLAPALVELANFRSGFDASLDFSVFLFAASATTAIALLAGLAPVRQAASRDHVGDLKSGSVATFAGAGRGRLRLWLLGGQAAVSLVLLVLAALVTRGLIQAATFDLGFASDRVLRASVWFSRGQIAEPRRMGAYWEIAVDRVRQIPGVAAVSLAYDTPFDGTGAREQLPSSKVLTRNAVDANYFDTIGARIVKGRTFTPAEVRDGLQVAVISERLAREFWPGADPIGATLDVVWGTPAPGPAATGAFRRDRGTQIVGVVADIMDDLRFHSALGVYLPIDRSDRSTRMVVRAETDPAAIVKSVRDALTAIDADIEIAQITLVSENVENLLRHPRAVSLFSGALGVCALVLSAIGLFGVTAFTVAHRRHEVGVRMALGASRAGVVAMVIRESLRPVAIGLCAGLAGACFVGQIVSRQLYGIGPRDPLAMSAAAAVLLMAALAAAFVPARRIAGINPAEVLKRG